MGGAAVLAIVFYLAIQWVRRCDQKSGGTAAESESLIPEKRDYRKRYGSNEWVSGKGVEIAGGDESKHIYANV